MIDTIIIKIPRDQIKTIDLSSQGISGWDLHSRTPNYEKYVRNPKNKFTAYMPRLTGVKRRVGDNSFDSFLKVEFSAPKMLYGNNLDEVEESDLEALIIAVQEKLKLMGVLVEEDIIRQAKVSSFHPSKNTQLTEGYTAIGVMKELSKINLSMKLDLDDKQFNNGGHCLQYYSNSHFILFPSSSSE